MENIDCSLLIKNMPDPVICCRAYEYDKDSADIEIIDANPAFESMTGIQKPGITGKKFDKIIPLHELWKNNWEKACNEAAHNSKSVRFEQYISKYACSYEITIYGVKPGYFFICFRVLNERSDRQDNYWYQRIYEQSPICIEVFDENGFLIDLNRSCLEVFGASSIDDVKGFSLFDDPNLPVEARENLLAGKDVNYETEFSFNTVIEQDLYETNKTGRINIDVSISPLKINGKVSGYIAQVQDITARKQAEEKLSESEARWNFALEGARDGVWDWDANNNKVFFSRRWKEMLGYEDYEIIGDDLSEWESRIHPDDREKVFRNLKEHLYGQAPYYEDEHRLLCKNGEYKWILDRGKVVSRDENGNPLRIIGTHVDISERKQMEKQLQETSAMIDALLDNTPGLISICDKNYRYVMLSRSIAETIGLEPDEVKGKTFSEVIPAGIARDFMQRVDKVRETQQPFSVIDTIPGEEGERVFETWLFPVQKTENDVELIGSVATEITETKRAEQRIEHLNSLLQSIRNVNQLIVQEQSIKELVQKACEVLVEARSYTGCAIALLDNEKNIIQPLSFAGKGHFIKEWSVTPEGVGSALHCVLNALNLNDLYSAKSSDCKNCRFGEFCSEYSKKIVIPMKRNGSTIGLLYISLKDDMELNQEEKELLEEVANDLVFAWDKYIAEDMLKKSEQKYRKLAEASEEIIITHDMEGRITFANNAVCRLIGYELENLQEKNVSDFLPEKEQDKLIKRMKNRQSGSAEIYRDDLEFLDRKGNKIPVDYTSVPLYEDSNIEGILITARDITERKRMEKELYDEKEYFRVTIESIGDAVIVTDVDRKVQLMNQTAEDLTTWTREEAYSRPVTEVFNIIDEKTRSISENPVSKVLKHGYVVGLANHTILIKRDGNEINIDDSGAPIRDSDGKITGAVLVFRDVTEERQAELEIHRAKDRFQALFNASPTPIFSFNLNGQVEMWNKAAEKIFGWKSEEVLGEFLPTLPPEKLEEYKELLSRVLAGESFTGFETSRMRKDGLIIFVSISAGPLHDAEGNIVGIIALNDDITERKQMEEKLKQSQKQVQEQKNILQSVLDNAPIGIWLVDQDQNPVIVNRFFMENTGFGTDDPSITPEEIAACKKTDEDALNKDIPQQYEEVVTFKDGKKHHLQTMKTKFFDKDGSILGILGLGVDITERKQMEEKLKESEMFNRAVINSLAEHIAILDKEGNITAVNNAWEKFAKDNEADLDKVGPGFNYLEVCKNATGEYAEQSEEALYGIRSVINGYQGEFVMEYPCHTPWREMWFAMYITALQVPSGGAVVSHIDITERKKAEIQLRSVNKQLEEIIEFLPDPTFVINNEGKVISWNRAMEEMTGICKENMLGLGDYIYSLPLYGKAVPILIDYINSGVEELPQSNYYYINQKNNMLYAEGFVPAVYGGKGAFLWLKTSPLYDSEGNNIGAIESIRDITERKQIEQKLEYLSQRDPLTELYNRNYFEQEMSRLEEDRCAPLGIIICDVDGLKLVNDTMGHASGDRLLVEVANIIRETFRKDDVIARVGGDEFAVLLPGSDEEDLNRACMRLWENMKKYNKQKPQIPVNISSGYAARRDYNVSVKDLFREADNNMYREKLHRKNSSRNAIVQTLTKALEARDFITEGHTDRLQDKIVILARALGMPEYRMSDLRLLAQFHDIGKVGIPDRILFKAGPLTEDEMEEMKRHCEIGYRIAQSADELMPIADCILKHHESWDGKGYPLGLKGDEIPLECRILAVIDAYDAMTNDRPYRKGLSHEEAVNEIKRCSGIQFDPKVVEEFLIVIEG